MAAGAGAGAGAGASSPAIVERLEKLLESDADVNKKIVNIKCSPAYYRYPLYLAMKHGGDKRLYLMEALIGKGEKVNPPCGYSSIDLEDNPYLYLAASRGDLEVVRLLLKKGANLTDSGGWGYVPGYLYLTQRRTTPILDCTINIDILKEFILYGATVIPGLVDAKRYFWNQAFFAIATDSSIDENVLTRLMADKESIFYVLFNSLSTPDKEHLGSLPLSPQFLEKVYWSNAVKTSNNTDCCKGTELASFAFRNGGRGRAVGESVAPAGAGAPAGSLLAAVHELRS